jgi:hypothetical protein
MNDRRPVQADNRSPIDAAIDEVERKRMEAELAKLEPRQAATIPLLTAKHAWTGKQEITVGAIPGDVPTFLMWDDTQGAFRAVVLPEGTSWRIVPDRSALWTPGGRS